MARKNPSKARFRSNSSLRRQSAQKPDRPSVLIVCEGEKTEPQYFNALRKSYKLGTVDIEIVGTGVSLQALIKHAIALRDQRREKARKSQKRGELGNPEFDQVWCVFDTESVPNHDLCYQAILQAEQDSLQVAVSNPAFEYWFLLHFTETTRPFIDASELIRELRKYISNYEKHTEVFSGICEYTDIALERAERLMHYHPDKTVSIPNPSTKVYALVRLIKSMANY